MDEAREMNTFLSDQTRLLVLVTVCAVLWSVESIAPLYIFRQRLRRALPNIGLAVFLVISNLTLSFATANVAMFTAQRNLGVLVLVGGSPWMLCVLGIAALDLFTYFAHLLLHKSWVGWQFHRVHHSDREVNVTTAFRQHPGETLWRILWQVLAVVIFGIPMWVVTLYLVISTANAQLEHANISLKESIDRTLRFLFVTPNMHKVHHSRLQFQTDTNYSNILSVWDRLMGTYTATVKFEELCYGLDGFDEEKTQTLAGLLKAPFVRHM